MARGIENEAVMVIARRRKTKQLLQQAMQSRGMEQVASSHHVGDALGGIVDHHGQVIARRYLPPRENHVAPGGRVGDDLALTDAVAVFVPEQPLWHLGQGPFHVEPQHSRPALGETTRPFDRVEMAAGARIERAAVGIGGAAPSGHERPGGARRLHGPARAETGKDELTSREFVQGRLVDGETVRLAPRRSRPSDAQPAKVLDDGGGEGFPAALAIDIFEPQQQHIVFRPGEVMVQQRRQGMAEMKQAVGRGCEPEYAMQPALLLVIRLIHSSAPPRCSVLARESSHAGPGSVTGEMTRIPRLPHRIDDEDDLDDALEALSARDPDFVAHCLAVGGRPPLRRRAAGFKGLAAMVVSQQVSTASAAAIFARLKAAVPQFEARHLLAASDAVLRDVGLSSGKVLTLRAVAAAIDNGALSLESLAELPADEAAAKLTALRGIGPWTAQLYLLSCLGHADAWPPGDVALEEAARLALGLEVRPDRASLARIAEGWRPYRAVAARLLWGYYRARKARDDWGIGLGDG